MKEAEITLGAMFEFVCEHLPDEWELEFKVTRFGCDLSLYDPGCNSIERCHDDMDTGDVIHDYVNFARHTEGLPALGWDGKPDAEWGPS